MTSKDYPLFRERVLAKTDGTNIHSVNGKLGIVLNQLSNAQFNEEYAFKTKSSVWQQEYNLRAAASRAAVNTALIDIKKMTGVSP